jgi:hypothetical protein
MTETRTRYIVMSRQTRPGSPWGYRHSRKVHSTAEDARAYRDWLRDVERGPWEHQVFTEVETVTRTLTPEAAQTVPTAMSGDTEQPQRS